MFELETKYELCTICEDEYTSINTEASPGVRIYVCDNCLRAAKTNFIWLCMSCGEVYLRPKELVIRRMNDREFKRAFMLCEDMQIIQGIDICIACDPDEIVNYRGAHKMALC